MLAFCQAIGKYYPIVLFQETGMFETKNARRYVLLVLPLLAAVLLYGYTIRLPFFLDDGPNFWLVQDIHNGDHWNGSHAFPFYRPLTFSLWKFTVTLIGGYEPSILHLLNVLFLGATGVFLGRIVQRLMPGPHRLAAGLAAGIGFVIFPFSYQAVTLISGMFHIMFALGLALSLWFALVWLDGRGGYFSLILCWISAFFGVFSHENGPLIVPLLAGLILVTYRGVWPSRRRIALVVVPITLIAGVYTILWFTVPRTNSQEEMLITNQFDLAMAHLLQGLAYPVVALARRLVPGEDVSPGPVILLVMVTTVPAWVWAWRQSRAAGLVAAYGAGWYVLSLLPSALLLAPDYVLGSPRLMLVASTGGSLFWGVIFALIVQHARTADRRVWVWGWRLTQAGFVVASLLVALSFLWLQRTDFIHLGDYTRRLMALIKIQYDDQAEFLIINTPNYVVPDEPMFLLGAEGAAFMLNSLEYAQLVWLNTGFTLDRLESQVNARAYDQTIKYQGGNFTPHQAFVSGDELFKRLHTASVIYVTYFEKNTFWPVYVGGANLPGPDTPIALDPDTNLQLTLAKASFSPDRNTLTVQTRWRVGDTMPLKLFVHVFCNGAFIGQSDGYVWGDLYPFVVWEPGEIQTDLREIRLSRPVNPDCLRLYTGAYWESDASSRLAFVNPATAEPYADGSIPVPLVSVTDDLIPFAQ
jgi:hypothetical protein